MMHRVYISRLAALAPALLSLILLIVTVQPRASAAWVTVVPSGLAQVDGNAASRVPFAYRSPVRYQQVYDASAFTNIPAGGAFITIIMFRADCNSIWSYYVSNVVVSLSTSPRAPDQLSSSFELNHGLDRVTVIGVSRYPSPTSPTGCPSEFDDGVRPLRLSVPFFYDPRKGNLLLDLQHQGIEWTGGDLSQSLTDTHDVIKDSVSRVAAFSLSADVGEIVDSMGLVTEFVFYPAPTLTNQVLADTLVVTWPYSPNTFQLQWTDALGAASWINYPGPIEYVGWWQANVPLATLSTPTFFRLFWDTPQPVEGIRDAVDAALRSPFSAEQRAPPNGGLQRHLASQKSPRGRHR